MSKLQSEMRCFSDFNVEIQKPWEYAKFAERLQFYL